MSRRSGFDRVELGLGLALLALLVALRLSVLRHAGPLWRDEVTSVNLAGLPSIAAILGRLHLDSFPALWMLVLHGWIGLGLGRNDLSLRLLGFLISLGAVGALWWTTARLRCGLPLVSTALFGASATVLPYTGAVRGYGLGVAAVLFLLGAIWNLTERPSPRSVATAAVAAIFAVLSAFASSILVFCFCLAGGIVAARNRNGKTIGALVAVGVLAAASVLPYLRTLARYGEFKDLLRMPVGIVWFLARFAEAVGGGALWAAWILLFAFSLAACLRRAFLADPATSRADRDLALFLLVAATSSLVGYFAYLDFLSVATQSWYYLAPMAILAVFFEAAIQLTVRGGALGRGLRLALVAGLVLWTAPSAWEAARTRMTNLDRVGAQIASRCAADDLVVLSPWYAGVTFERYYHGAAPWMSLPDFAERRFQPFVEFKRKMAEPEPIAPVLERIGRTLEAGRAVWLVGEFPLLREGERPEVLPPAPHPQLGWDERAYEWAWLRQTAYFIQTRGTQLESIPVPVEGPVSRFENLPLQRLSGWSLARGTGE